MSEYLSETPTNGYHIPEGGVSVIKHDIKEFDYLNILYVFSDSFLLNMSQQAGPSRMHPHDPKFKEWCMKVLNEDNTFINDGDNGSHFSESEHDTESCQSLDDNDMETEEEA
ncbi:hypothetical protein FQR65_LT15979 [Abscondita terminalis]|nr:hypothetical protein FQR65_LT15979 [Abscondita terminalis]